MSTPSEIYDINSDTRYFPVMGGWRVEQKDQPTEFVYLNPSGGSDDGIPTIFLYRGPSGDPSQDMPVAYLDLSEPT